MPLYLIIHLLRQNGCHESDIMMLKHIAYFADRQSVERVETIPDGIKVTLEVIDGFGYHIQLISVSCLTDIKTPSINEDEFLKKLEEYFKRDLTSFSLDLSRKIQTNTVYWTERHQMELFN